MGRVDEDAAIDMLRFAIDNGVTLIDTAQAYRSSEEVIGRALAGGYRERCFLATKASGGSYTQTAMREAMEQSLRALRSDYVDLYQIHGWRGDVPLEEQIGTLVDLQQEGKTRYIGVSNYNAEQMQAAVNLHSLDSLQPRYNLMDRNFEEHLLPFCVKNGIGVLAHSTLAKGLLTGRYRPGHQFAEDDERTGMDRFRGETFATAIGRVERLRDLAMEKGVSLVQLAIAWVLRDPAVTCALVGAKSSAQITEHLGSVDLDFTPEDLAFIDSVLGDVAHPI
jgi:myo-inositol catabolism protein IolS